MLIQVQFCNKRMSMKYTVFFVFLFLLSLLNKSHAQVVQANVPVLKITITSQKPYCFSERGELIVLAGNDYQFQTMIGSNYYSTGTQWFISESEKSYIYKGLLHAGAQHEILHLVAQYAQLSATLTVVIKSPNDFYNTCTKIPRPIELDFRSAARLG